MYPQFEYILLQRILLVPYIQRYAGKWFDCRLILISVSNRLINIEFKDYGRAFSIIHYK